MGCTHLFLHRHSGPTCELPKLGASCERTGKLRLRWCRSDSESRNAVTPQPSKSTGVSLNSPNIRMCPIPTTNGTGRAPCGTRRFDLGKSLPIREARRGGCGSRMDRGRPDQRDRTGLEMTDSSGRADDEFRVAARTCSRASRSSPPPFRRDDGRFSSRTLSMVVKRRTLTECVMNRPECAGSWGRSTGIVRRVDAGTAGLISSSDADAPQVWSPGRPVARSPVAPVVWARFSRRN